MTWTISTPRDTWIAQAKTAWAALEPYAPRARTCAPSPPSRGMPDRGDTDADAVEDW